MDDLDKDRHNELDSLEDSTTVVESTGNGTSPGTPAGGAVSASPQQGMHIARRLLSSLNIYLLLFILLLVLSGIGGSLLYLKAHSENLADNTPAPQALSTNTLDSLANSDVTVGEPKHTLSVQSNAVFSGDILARGNLQVAGTLQVGSNLAINGIRVTGNSTFDDVQVTKSLAVTDNGSFQGQLTIQKSLNVNGGGTFLGALSAPSITAGSLQLNGDLTLTHHVSAGGATPSRSSGPALGSGGTVSISGSDTAGSVTVNTGSGPAAGCFVTISFTRNFNSTPHVVITPVGAAAADLHYYINRSTGSFSICSTAAAPGGTTFGFDYLAFD